MAERNEEQTTFVEVIRQHLEVRALKKKGMQKHGGVHIYEGQNT